MPWICWVLVSLFCHQQHTHHHEQQLVTMLASWTTHFAPLPWKTFSSLLLLCLLLQTPQTHCYFNQSCKHASSNHFKSSLNPWKNFLLLKDKILEFQLNPEDKKTHTPTISSMSKNGVCNHLPNTTEKVFVMVGDVTNIGWKAKP